TPVLTVPPPPASSPLSLHDALPILGTQSAAADVGGVFRVWDVVPFETILVSVDSLSLASPLTVPAYGSVSLVPGPNRFTLLDVRSEEHTSELQSRFDLVCRLLLEKK